MNNVAAVSLQGFEIHDVFYNQTQILFKYGIVIGLMKILAPNSIDRATWGDEDEPTISEGFRVLRIFEKERFYGEGLRTESVSCKVRECVWKMAKCFFVKLMEFKLKE